MTAYIYRNKITFDRGLLDDYIFTTINEYREDYATDEEIATEWKKVKQREITLPQLLKIIALGYILMEAQ